MKRKTLIERHLVTLLGISSTVIPGFLGIENLIAKDHVKFWLAAGVVIGAITTQRGMAAAKQEKTP